jgi:hydroxyacylglutathione hydrolase
VPNATTTTTRVHTHDDTNPNPVNRTLASGGYTVPSTVGEELTFNPFMRVREPAVVAAAQRKGGAKGADPATIMSALREMKNSF